MNILFNDVIQFSNAPKAVKSPALSEIHTLTYTNNFITFDLGGVYPINAIGVGNVDANALVFYFNFGTPSSSSFTFTYSGNGLYVMPESVLTRTVTMSNTGATHIGRLSAGLAVNIPTSIAKEPAFCSTAEPRITLSGQVIAGAGGYNYRTISLDSRYKIDSAAMQEIQNGYKYIGMGYPFFIDLTDESYKLPFNKFYANERNQRQMSFEGGIRKYLYSRRWEFEERF